MSNLSTILAQVKQGNSKAIAILINHIYISMNKLTNFLKQAKHLIGKVPYHLLLECL